MKKILLRILFVILIIILLGGILFYFNQEKIIFYPEKTASDFKYNFPSDFEEVYLTTEDQKKLHALHFKTENPKGVVYYLHGNAGNLEGWGDIASLYLDLNYDIFILDFRGFGKQESDIRRYELWKIAGRTDI